MGFHNFWPWQCLAPPQVLSRIWLLILCVPSPCFLFFCLPLDAMLLVISISRPLAAPLSRPPVPAAEVTVPSVQFCPCASFCLCFSAKHTGQEQHLLPLCAAWPTADPRIWCEASKPINREQDSALGRQGFNSCIELEREKLPAGTR